jgi:hypothetical protein
MSTGRSDRPEDPRTEPVVLLRFYDDDHGPCGSYRVAGGVTTLAVPAGAEEVTVDLVLPEPGGLAGAADAEVLEAAGRLLDRYPEPGFDGGLHDLARTHVLATAVRARKAERDVSRSGLPGPDED